MTDCETMPKLPNKEPGQPYPFDQVVKQLLNSPRPEPLSKKPRGKAIAPRAKAKKAGR